MKKKILYLLGIILSVCLSGSLYSQTAGTLTFKFTQVPHSPCYEASKNVLAVWIQTNTGGFVKTKLRNVGSVTSDHLPVWAVNAGGPASNCLSSSCNKTDATTGATLTSFSTKTITWDGKNVNGTSNGTTVADGVYKVTIESTWNHSSSSTVVTSYTFTKGPNADHQTPANDANFTSVTLDWLPTPAGMEDIASEIEGLNVYPNPSIDGIFNVDFEQATRIKVIDLLGSTLWDVNVERETATKNIDISNLANGIYFIYVFDGDRSSKRKVILNK